MPEDAEHWSAYLTDDEPPEVVFFARSARRGVQVVTPDAAGDPRGIRARAVSPRARVPPCRS